MLPFLENTNRRFLRTVYFVKVSDTKFLQTFLLLRLKILYNCGKLKCQNGIFL